MTGGSTAWPAPIGAVAGLGRAPEAGGRRRRAVIGWLGVVVAMLLVLVGSPAHAQTFPKFTGLVVDAANVLPEQERASLTAKLQSLQKDTGYQLVVATIPDLQGYELADYGNRLIRAWGVGLKGADSGAILFIAPNEPKGHRGPRIEVGYGLEGTLTDALSWQIIHDRMMPLLEGQHDVPAAMQAGADAVIAQLRLPADQAKARTAAAVQAYDKTHRRGQGGGLPLGLIFWLVLIAAFLGLRWFGRGRGDTAYPGPGGGLGGGGGSNWPIWLWAASEFMGERHRGDGGFGSGFGGGSSDGGGSDGGWMGGGFTGGGGGSGGGGGASGDW